MRGLHQRIMAAVMPQAVPKRNPAVVSATEVPTWMKRSPELKRPKKVSHILDGQLKINESMAPTSAASSHIRNIIKSRAALKNRTVRFSRRSPER